MSRTIEFDREEVLKQAMYVFWKGGYCKSSMSNLVSATQLKPGSIYAAFNSKEGLFLAALDYYAEGFIANLKSILSRADTPLQGVKNFIREIAEQVLTMEEPSGCLFVNTILESSVDDTEIMQRIKQYLTQVEGIFSHAFEQARLAGEISARENPQTMAKYLMVNIWGLRVLAKTKPDKKSVAEIVAKIFAQFTAK